MDFPCSLCISCVPRARGDSPRHARCRRGAPRPRASESDAEGGGLTALQSGWRISEGRPGTKEVAVAKHWACEAGARVVHAAIHLHGGIGVDKEYPLHRYFTYARQLELTLGGSTQQLLKLGAVLANEAA